MNLQAQLSDIEALVERVKEARLRDLLKQGIGYLHEGMHPADQDILHTLFQSGAIQVHPPELPVLFGLWNSYQSCMVWIGSKRPASLY